MRLFIITDSACDYKVVEISKYIWQDNEIKVHLNYWQDIETYKIHGNSVQPIKTETHVFNFDLSTNDSLTNFIYAAVSQILPSHQIISHKPRE